MPTKASLQLQLNQQLKITPQLQHAIRLLQFSTQELIEEIQTIIEANPLLDLEEIAFKKIKSAKLPSSTTRTDDAVKTQEIPEELPNDSTWEDFYPNAYLPKNSIEEDDKQIEEQYTVRDDLHTHLTWQMNLTPFTDRDRLIATVIIEAIDDDGFLTTSLEEIAECLQKESPEIPFEKEEILAVLHLIQRFDPLGSGSRNLQESLLIQLEQWSNNNLWVKAAKNILQSHFSFLINKQYDQLLNLINLSQEDLLQVIKLIQSLNPRPGAQIAQPKMEYQIPDIIVKKIDSHWEVELNLERIPRLKINAHYSSLISKTQNKADYTYLKNNLQEAYWLIKSLKSRNDTLLKVARYIVNYQKEFLEHGDIAMKPLVLSTVANALGLHESTISRATTQKYLSTPRGLFELKYFFSSHVLNAKGEEASATSIRALIKELIEQEDRLKPLSDYEITRELIKKGIKVARRTITKYREAAGIPTSHERKILLSEILL